MTQDIIEFDELLIRSKKGDIKSLELILSKLKPFIIKNCRSVYLKNYSMDDLVSISNLSIYNAIQYFDFKKSQHFFPYVIRSIKNNLNMEIRKASKNWREDSLEGRLDGSGEGFLNSGIEKSIEDEYIKSALVEELMKELSYEEKSLIDSIYYKDMTIHHYAEINKLEYKKCSNMKLKALKKMRKRAKSKKIK